MADVTIRLKADGDNIYTGHAAHTDIYRRQRQSLPPSPEQAN